MNKAFKFLATTIAIISLVITIHSCSTPKTVVQTDLSGFWTLKTLKGEVATDAFKGSIPSIEFDFEKQQVAGSAGCNRYFGGFTLENNLFKAPALATTMMICIEDNKEGEFTATLGNKDGLTISIENGVLTFKEGSAIVLEFTKGENLPKTAEATPIDNNSLIGSWTLSKIKGNETANLFGEDPATFIYTDGGAVNGNAGCNNYRSQVSLNGDTISFAPIASTRIACPNLEGEQTFLNILSTPVEGSIKGDKLFFSQKGEPVLEFVKDKK